MQRDEYVLSQQGSFPSMNDSSSNPYQYSYFPNVNVSEKSQQRLKNLGSERLDNIISKAFENLQNQQFQTDSNESQYQNERMRLDFQPINHNNAKRGQKENRFFFNIENQTQSILNSSNKDSFQRVKQRVPGKLTQSDESLQKNELKRSQNEDHYYNFTIKNSTLNSEYLFNEPEYNQNSNYEISYGSKLWQTSLDHTNHPSYLQGSNHKNQQKAYYEQIESAKLPAPNRSGFIRQNKLNSRSKSKQKQLSRSRSSHASTKNRKLIAQREQFRVHYQQPNKNSKYHNQILDEDFWRKLDEHKSTSESLKQTFDSQKTNNYQLNSLLNNNVSIRKKDRTHYSQIGRDNRFNDSVCSSEVNPYIKEYENDLFDFIKKELINTTVENRELSEKEKEVTNEYNVQKKKNSSLYNLYKKTKLQVRNLIEKESNSMESMKVKIKLLEEQILFYRQHSIMIEQSIAEKINKQEDFYFKHKAHLQEIIFSNNQQMADLKNELFKVQHLQKRQTKDQGKEQKIGSLESSIRQNYRLKQTLREQQLLYQRSLKKLTQNHTKVQELQKKKAEQIKGLVEGFENAKRLIKSFK